MRILVTGAAGLVGSNLCHKLVELGYDVTGIDNLQFGYEKNLPKGMNFFHRGIHQFHYEVNNYDVLVSCHTANIIYAINNPIATWETNCIDTVELFSRFRGKIIYTSTSSIYGDSDTLPTPEDAPLKMTNAYARSKYVAELFLKDRGNYTTLRLTNTYGRFQYSDHPFSGVMGKLIGNSLKGEKSVIYGDGSQTRDFVYVDDVADAIIKVIDLPTLNTEINIGTGKETSINELVEAVKEVIPSMAVECVEGRPIDNINRRCLDIKKAEQLLNWLPRTDVKEGIKLMVEWLSLSPTTCQK